MTKKQRHLMLKTALELVTTVLHDVEADNNSGAKEQQLIYLNASHVELTDTLILFRSTKSTLD